MAKEKIAGENSILYLWQKIKNLFVEKENNKGLSSNDFTDEFKTKLTNIENFANKTIITDNLTSTSTTSALSANQGKVLDEKITNLSLNAGAGDMLKTTYDTNANGKVDTAEDSEKLGGELPSAYVKASALHTVATSGSYNDLTDKPTNFAPTSHNHAQSEITGLSTALTDMENIANGKCASYVFDTVADLETWLGNATNTANLKIGDVFLIKAVDVPDYWWDGTGKSVLETTKVELTMLTNQDIDDIVAGTYTG